MNKEFWNEQLNIDGLQVPRFMAAPLDGVTDSPLRQLIREYSPEELLFTEMRHVASIVHSKKDNALKFEKKEKPLCFQISTNKTSFIERAIEQITENVIS